MKIITTIKDIRDEIKLIKKSEKSLGFVPTMGYLHAGHQSLMEEARKTCDIVIVSIFVNPLQFGINEDLDKYPRNLDQDTMICINADVDIIFVPNANEIIGQSLVSSVNIKELSSHLCGNSRPGHFDGVCTIVTKLFNIIQPNKAFFGQKDIQQLQIVRKLVIDLNFDIEIIGVDIKRNSDGLALSSRNSYLNNEELQTALIVPFIIKKIYNNITTGKSITDVINESIIHVNSIDRCRVDYIEVVDYNTLQPIDNYKNDLIIAVAIFIGKTRLIDNMILGGHYAN